MEETTGEGRVEDRALTTGSGRFVEDLADDTTLWAGFVRSPAAHGRIVDIETEDVDPEVYVFANGDLGLEAQPGKLRESLPGHVDYRRPILADAVVRFAGEAVALVVGESQEAVADAMERVWVNIDELPAVVTVEAAMEDTHVLFPVVGTNRALTASFSTAELPQWGVGPEITLEVDSPRVAPSPMEPLAILVVPEEGGFSVRASTQTPHRLRIAIADSLGIAHDTVRVAIPEVGGAFGQKGAVYVEYLAVARAAQLLRRPVMWVQGRRDNLLSATHGRGQKHSVRLGGLMDGTLTQAEIEIVGDLGAYPQMGGVVPVTSAALASGPYSFERFSVTATGVLTNLNPTGPYRGAGRPEATYALERAVDAFALHIGVPSHEVRRRSLIAAHTTGVVGATGLTYDSGDYRSTFNKAMDLINPEAIAQERAERLAAGERTSVGAAVTCFIERAGGPVQFGECAVVELLPDGTVAMRLGSAPSGQGHRTVFQGIVRDVLGVSGDSITWVAGDTAATETGGGTYGSRSGQLGGSATLLAANHLAEQCLVLAAEHFGVLPDQLVLEGGAVLVRGGGGTMSLAEVAGIADARGEQLLGASEFVAEAQTFPYGAHGAVVEVDLDTGEIYIRRVVAVDDAGTILNPMIASGQIQGSLAQGLGQAMLEHVEFSSDGTLLSGTFMDYLLPSAMSTPDWDLHHLETPAPSNPLGAKGVGESGTIGLPPSLVNATIDALSPFGVTSLEMPLTPRRVWEALAAAGAV